MEFDSLTASKTCNSTRIKFINLLQPEIDKGAAPAKFMSNLTQILRPLVKEAVTNIVQFSTSVPDSPRLAGFVLDMLFTPFIDLAHQFGVPSCAFYTSGAGSVGFKFYVQALYDEQNVYVVEIRLGH
ncbi:hypothetical protein PTKIN_Ptkin12aG0010900 [Pterospermum kingtungense]